VSREREELKRKLSDIERDHDRCRKKEKDMKISYEQSIQGMRMQMEQLMKEETETSVYLEKQLKEKEKLFQEECSNMKDEIASREEQINTLNGDLKDARDQQQCYKAEVEQLNTEIARLQNEIKNHSQLEEKRSDGIDEVLQKSEDDKQQLMAAFEEDKTKLTKQIANLELQLSKEKANVKVANERVLEIESTLIEVEEQHNCFLQNVKESFKSEQIGFQERKDKEIGEKLKCMKDVNERELDCLKQEYDNEIRTLKNKTSTMEEKLQKEREHFEKIKLEHDLAIKELKEKYEEDARNELSKHEDQLEGEKLRNKQHRDELNNKIKELEADYEKINNVKDENEGVKLELLQKNEMEKSNREEIQRLKERLDGQVDSNLEHDLKASQDKVLELSTALQQTQRQYNDSIVENDEVCQRLRSCEKDLEENQSQVEHLNSKLHEAERASSRENEQKADVENELNKTKAALEKHTSEIENLLKGREVLVNELEEFKRSSESFKIDRNKINNELEEQISQNEELMEKLSIAEEELTKLKEEMQQQSNSSPSKCVTKEAATNENKAADYSSSFDDDEEASSSTTTKSVSFKTTSSFKSEEYKTHSKEDGASKQDLNESSIKTT